MPRTARRFHGKSLSASAFHAAQLSSRSRRPTPCGGQRTARSRGLLPSRPRNSAASPGFRPHTWLFLPTRVRGPGHTPGARRQLQASPGSTWTPVQVQSPPAGRSAEGVVRLEGAVGSRGCCSAPPIPLTLPGRVSASQSPKRQDVPFLLLVPAAGKQVSKAPLQGRLRLGEAHFRGMGPARSQGASVPGGGEAGSAPGSARCIRSTPRRRLP